MNFFVSGAQPDSSSRSVHLQAPNASDSVASFSLEKLECGLLERLADGLLPLLRKYSEIDAFAFFVFEQLDDAISRQIKFAQIH